MNAIRSLVVAALLAGGVEGASAQLYSRDSEFGADTVVVDIRTGLSWLQLSQAINVESLDFSDDPFADNWTVQSGAYEGYRVATGSEISVLWDNNIGRWYGSNGWVSTDPLLANRALDLIRLFGGDIITESDGGQYGFAGGAADHFGGPFGSFSGMWVAARSGPTGSYIASDCCTGSRTATYLIAPIPEPSTYALMLAGLGAVAFAARRRKAKTDQLFA